MNIRKLLAALAVFALLASACGSDDSSDTSASGSGSESATATADDGSDDTGSDDAADDGEDTMDDEEESAAAGPCESPYGTDFVCDLEANEEYLVGVSLQQQKANFWVSVKSGSTDAAVRAAAAEPTFADANSEDDKQLNDVKNMIASGIDGLVLGATNSGSAVGIAEEAIAAGIPVVAVALQIGDPAVFGGQHVYEGTLALVTNDDKDMGAKAAQFVQQVAADADGPLNIVILQGTPGTSNATLRDEGFKEALDELGIDYEITNEQTGRFKREEAQVACDNMLAADYSIDLIYSHSDEMTIGCVTSMESAGRTDIPVASIGGNTEGIALVANGSVLGTVCQKPATMGAVATQLIIRHLNGESIPAEPFFYETPTITAENLDDCVPEW
ncbi:MAG: sugar ABC transporter substrate-binding protein [Actinomycetota bacterium]